MGKFKDLTGQTFGRLKVLKRAENYKYPSGQIGVRYLCECQCKNKTKIEVFGRHLTSGNTQSCGCLSIEVATQRLYEISRKYNHYQIFDDYVVGMIDNDDYFYADIEDYHLIKDVYWSRNGNGYIENIASGILMHRLVMSCPDGYDVDHIGGDETRNDNRKNNLRIATRSENAKNSKLNANNTSGVTGVGWSNYKKKWRARITINYKTVNLGWFDDFDDAVKARKEAEEKYFGEWSYDYSQKLYKQANKTA